MIEYLNVVVIIVAGSEPAIAAFVHPTLGRLPDNVHLPVASSKQKQIELFNEFLYPEAQ